MEIVTATINVDTTNLRRLFFAAAAASRMIRLGEVELGSPDLAEKAVAQANEMLRALDDAAAH